MFLDVTLQPRKDEKKEEKVAKKSYSFEYENSINLGKELIDMDAPLEHKYSQWRTNAVLSNHVDTLIDANAMNTNYHLSDKLHYHYLFHKIRKMKRFSKKKTEFDKIKEQEIKEEQEKIHLIQEVYKYNIVKAKMAMKILSEDQFEFIRKSLEKGG
jgi:hypothetical protein